MVVKAQSSSDDNIKYNFTKKGGRNLIERQPLFSPDGESLAVIVENKVRVYNVQTGDCVRILETEKPTNELIAIEFPENNYDLYGCSDNGCVTIWTWENGALLREIDLKLQKGLQVSTFNLINSNECLITGGSNSHRLTYIASFSLKTGAVIKEYTGTVVNYTNLIKVSIGWCQGEQFAAIINGSKKLYIQNLQRSHVKQIFISTNNFRLVGVAAHKTSNIVAITDTFGRLTICRGNFFHVKGIAREVLHWHFLPLPAVCFSLQGNYIYSGGIEKVLVKWTIGSIANKVNERLFIPRLPGTVRYITTNNTHVAITLSNNSIVIANAQMCVERTIIECGGLSPITRTIGMSLVYFHKHRALLMPGKTGHIQLLSTITDKVIYNVDITELNDIPTERANLLPIDTEVVCAAVSANGDWLVTSEYRNDGIMYPEERLKFWSACKKGTRPFKLNTCVNLSHGGCIIVSLALNDTGDFCVSSGADQKFRIWKCENASLTTIKKTAWVCVTACYYSSGVGKYLSHGVLNDFKTGELLKMGRNVVTTNKDLPYLTEMDAKNDIVAKLFNKHKVNAVNEIVYNSGVKQKDESDMGGVAISQDGSLIAAWFGCKLTLWDTHLSSLRTTLSHPALQPKGVDVLFGNNDAAHYLVCTTQKCLAVWSLLSLTVKWLVQTQPTCLAADRFSNRMAIVTENNDVFVFRPHSAAPLLARARVLPRGAGAVRHCAFAAAPGEDVKLYMSTNNAELYCLEPVQSEEDRLEVISRRNLPKSNFSALLAEQRVSEVKSAVPTEDIVEFNANGNVAISQFASASPHMVPPVSLLCTTFLQQLSGIKEDEEIEVVDEETPMDVDPSSDEEDDQESKRDGTFVPRVTELWTPNYEVVKEKKLNKIMKEPFLDLHSTSAMFGI